MITISKIIYNITGKMTKNHIMKTAESIGTDLAKKSKDNRTVTVNDIKDVVQNTIGKKKASRIIISDDINEFIKFTKENLNMPEELAQDFYYNSVAAAVPSPKKKTFLKINVKDFSKISRICNAVGHEFEHLLFQNFSFRAYFERLYIKIRGANYINKYLENTAHLVNEKSMEIQYYLGTLSNLGNDALGGFSRYKRGLGSILTQTGAASKKELHSVLKEIVNLTLLPDDEKSNRKILKGIKQVLKDESRAYNVGGKVEKTFYPKTKKATKSEMLADIYDETIKVINTELKARKISRFKRFFGQGGNVSK